ncbi:MAG: electron transfer flavoprotein subunit beta, partial [Elusimicrobia bacterium]|nr:electron transfer flavoprotein subunit beta [Elusimicrobiota bacterium]
KKAVIKKWTATDVEADTNRIGLSGSPTQVMKIFYPPARQGGEKLHGESQEQAQQLVSKLKEMKVI